MAGFDVSYAFGKLTIGSIVVPNNAMKFQEDGPLDLLLTSSAARTARSSTESC